MNLEHLRYDLDCFVFIASDWHSSQWSALYAFSCNGTDSLQDASDVLRLMSEVKSCIQAIENQPYDKDGYGELVEFYNLLNTIELSDDELE